MEYIIEEIYDAEETTETGQPDGYNGWANYQTWNIALWVGNDEPTYRKAMHLMTQWNACPATPEEAERLTKELYPDGTPDLYNVEACYDGVDWSEIAEMYQEMYEG